MENAPVQTITTTELQVEVDRPRKRRGQRESIPKPKQQGDPFEEPPKDTGSRSSGSGKEAKWSQRSEPFMLKRVTAILQDTPPMIQRQCEDAVLGKIRKELQGAGNRGAGGGEYVMDDNGLLWVAPLGKVPQLAVPQSLVPGIMALAHSTYRHLGTAITTALVSRRYCWPTFIRDVRDYVLSCGCRRRKPSSSQRVAMLPARFLRPGEVLEVDIQDRGMKSNASNKVLLVAVDKASKFLLAFQLPTKKALGVARKLLEVMLTFGLPLYVRSDPGSEFTAEVMQHLCKWLNVTIAYGPADHPRRQGIMEILVGWLHKTLGELCKTWPRRWDECVQPALWIHRTTPDLRLPGKPTPFRLFFCRDARTQLDATHPEIVGGDFRGGMHSYVADKRQAYNEVRDVRAALLKIHDDRQKTRESRNAEIGRTSAGTRVVVGDEVLVKEAESVTAREGIHHKLAHEHSTGPWEVTEVVLPGISYIVTMNGRGVRRRWASVANIKMFHLRPDDLHHDFENGFAHLAWGVDFGPAEPSIVASPMYTLIGRKAVMGQGNAWKWRYEGRFVDGSKSPWLSEEEARDSLNPLQLDVFHALWETYHEAECQARPTSTLTRKERDGDTP